MTVHIAERGQITLPKALRDRYGINAERLADQIRDQLESQGETLESMLKLARSVRDGASKPRPGPA